MNGETTKPDIRSPYGPSNCSCMQTDDYESIHKPEILK